MGDTYQLSLTPIHPGMGDGDGEREMGVGGRWTEHLRKTDVRLYDRREPLHACASEKVDPCVTNKDDEWKWRSKDEG